MYCHERLSPGCACHRCSLCALALAARCMRPTHLSKATLLEQMCAGRAGIGEKPTHAPTKASSRMSTRMMKCTSSC